MAVHNAASGMFIRTLTEADFFLINDHQAEYAIARSRDLDRCKRGDPMVCPASLPIYYRHHEACASALYFNDAERSRRLCKQEVVVGTPRDEWYFDEVGQRWLFSVPKKITLSFNCLPGSKSNARDIEIEGQGEVDVSGGCRIITKTYELPSSEVRQGASQISTPVVHMMAQNQLQINSEGEKTSIQPSDLQELIYLSRERGRVSHDAQNQETIDLDYLLQLNDKVLAERSYLSTTYWSVGAATLIILTGVLSIWCYRRWKRRPQQTEGEAARRDIRLVELPTQQTARPDQQELVIYRLGRERSVENLA